MSLQPLKLFFSCMLYFFAVLDLVHENFGWLKSRYIMLINHQGCVTRNVPRNFLFAFFVDKASKTTNVDVIAAGHRTFDDAEECFNRCCYIGFINPGLFCDFVNNVCFGHCVIFLVRILDRQFREGKFKSRLQN